MPRRLAARVWLPSHSASTRRTVWQRTFSSSFSGRGALRIAAAGTTPDEVRLRLSLPDAGRARVELVDVSGRRRTSRECAGPLEGATLALPLAAPLEPGRYFARVTQRGLSASTSVTVLR